MSCVNCYNYSTWKLLAWWLYIQYGLSYRCNPYVGVSCKTSMIIIHHSHHIHIQGTPALGITPIRQSGLYIQPPSQQLPHTVIITIDTAHNVV